MILMINNEGDWISAIEGFFGENLSLIVWLRSGSNWAQWIFVSRFWSVYTVYIRKKHFYSKTNFRIKQGIKCLKYVSFINTRYILFSLSLLEKCAHSELFWFAFSRIRIRRETEYLSVFSPNAGKCGPE